MLKITGNTRSTANTKETEGRVGCNNVVGNLIGGGEATNLTKRKNPVKMTKFKILVKSKNHDFPKSRPEKAGTGFFIPKTRLAFIQLR